MISQVGTMGRRVRLRDVPALPLLYLLHLVFTLSSLLLRLYEALRASVTSDNRDTGAAVSRSTTNAQPPRHVALVLALSGSSARKLSGTSRGKRQSARWREAAVESVRRASSSGRSRSAFSTSVYTTQKVRRFMLRDVDAEYAAGLLQAVVSELQSEYQPLPPSPPSSTASPSLRLRAIRTSLLRQTHRMKTSCTMEGPRSSDSSLGKHSRTGRSAEVVFNAVRIWSSAACLAFWARRCGPDSSITRDFIRAGTPTSDVTQQMIDAEVQGAIPSQKCSSVALTTSSPAAQPTARLAACSSATASLAVAITSATSSSGAARVPLLASPHHRDLAGFSSVRERRTSADTDSLQPAPASITSPSP